MGEPADTLGNQGTQAHQAERREHQTQQASRQANHPGFDENTMACAEAWAADIAGPAYAIDDQTAIQVVDGRVEVVSEGNWRYFGP